MSLFLRLLLLSLAVAASARAQRPDTLWFRHDNRFTPHRLYEIAAYDTADFLPTRMVWSKPEGQTGKRYIGYVSAPGVFQFTHPGRILYQPASMPGDFTSSSNHWNFERSQESEHFVCFWEEGSTANISQLLNLAEKTWDVYTRRLGFVKEGQSSTDTHKILIRAYNTTGWVASGSGEDLKVGTFNISPSAVGARGGHTVAHEIGHTFQYLTNVDCGADNTHGFNYGLGENGEGGNGFWEDCANWMAYKVYPERQFTDGEYFEGYLDRCHLNLMHEDGRYYNCFYQDFLCDRFGEDFIGRLWREAIRPEDPVDATKRLQGLSQDEFSALMYDCFARMCTWDTPSIREAAAHRHGAHANHLRAVDLNGEEWFQVDSAHCPQNYGYNITRLKVPAAGTTLRVEFQGLTGETGYRNVNPSRSGWRWGLVCQQADGSTLYSPMQQGRTGSLDYLVPEQCQNLWLVVMGAPTQWWHHAWDNSSANDEQWPYRVKLTGTRPYGLFRTYTADDFPAGYVRRDTTLVIQAQLPYSGSNYSSVRVQYDLDALSEALGLTTAQLKGIRASASANPRFVGISANGSLTPNTTTSTSSTTRLGHWFSTTGNVTGYDGHAAVFAEMYPDSYGCYVGQYPGRLRAGQTYTIRQGIVYRAPDGITRRATVEVRLKVT